MQNDVSIEYAHIYTNQHIQEEHRLSLSILTELKQDYDAQGKTMSLVVMVDDYSFPDPTFDYEQFVTWLDTHNLKPDVLFRESQLVPLCDEVLKLLTDEKLKAQLVDYIKAKKYPCSLFIAAWYLLRLGKLNSSLFDSAFRANSLLNILPESFKPFEDKGLEIIAATPYQDCVHKISYKFLSGRLIA